MNMGEVKEIIEDYWILSKTGSFVKVTDKSPVAHANICLVSEVYRKCLS